MLGSVPFEERNGLRGEGVGGRLHDGREIGAVGRKKGQQVDRGVEASRLNGLLGAFPQVVDRFSGLFHCRAGVTRCGVE